MSLSSVSACAGYRVTKQLDPESAQRSLLFEVEYPEIEDGLQPRHRFMSAFEQRVCFSCPKPVCTDILFAACCFPLCAPAYHLPRANPIMCTLFNMWSSFNSLSHPCTQVEAPDKTWQYLLFAAEPYETIGFKIPNMEIDKDPSKFQTTWNDESKTFLLQLYFKTAGLERKAPAPSLMRPGLPAAPPTA